MSGIPFDTIAAAALSQAPSLLSRWFPHGRIVGHEFKVGNIDGDPGESLSINLHTGAWADFSAGIKGGDLTAVCAAKFHSGNQVAAALELAKDLGVYLNGYTNGHGARTNGAASAPAAKPN